jgi:hypothetical protein
MSFLHHLYWMLETLSQIGARVLPNSGVHDCYNAHLYRTFKCTEEASKPLEDENSKLMNEVV